MANEPKLVVFGSNHTYEGTWGSGTLPVVSGAKGESAAPVRDVLRFRTWSRSATQWAEYDWVARSTTGKTATWVHDTVVSCVDSLTGLVYFLETNENINSTTTMLGGALMSFNPQTTTTITETVNTHNLYEVPIFTEDPGSESSDAVKTRLFFPRDIKIDVGRRLLWIADSGNHRILGIDADSYYVRHEYVLSNYCFPVALTVDDGTGDVYVRVYADTNFTEKVVRFHSNSITATYDGLGAFGWTDFTTTTNAGSVLVMEAGDTASHGAYLVGSTGSVSLFYSSGGLKPLAASVEGMSGTVVIEHQDGYLTALSPQGILLDMVKNEVNPAVTHPLVFPSHFDATHWVWSYDSGFSSERLSKDAFRNVALTTATSSATIPGCPLKGVAGAYNRYVFILSDNGNQLTKLSPSGDAVLQQVSLGIACDMLDVKSDGSVVYVTQAGQPDIYLYDGDLNLLGSATLGFDIQSIAVNQNQQDGLWVVHTNNRLILYDMVLPTPSALYTLDIVSGGLLGVKDNYKSGGCWVYDQTQVYQVSSVGVLVNTVSGFVNIQDIAPFNYLANLGGLHRFPFPSASSIVCDTVRNQVWWVADGLCRNVVMVDTIGNIDYDHQIYCESSSSSSSSSFSSLSSSSSSSYSSSSSNSSSSSSSSIVKFSSSSSSSSSSSYSSSSSSSSSIIIFSSSSSSTSSSSPSSSSSSSKSSNSSSSSSPSSSSSSSPSSSSSMANFLDTKNTWLAGYWDGQTSGSTWLDALGVNNFTGAGFTTTGKHGNGLGVFVSGGSDLNKTFPTGLNPTTSAAMSVWISQFADSCGIIMVDALNLQIDNLGLHMYANNYDVVITIPTPSIPVGGLHIVSIADSGILRLYVSGLLIGSLPYSPPLSGSSIVAGAYVRALSGNDFIFDELAYWNDIPFASNSERQEFVQALYKSGIGRFYTGGFWG